MYRRRPLKPKQKIFFKLSIIVSLMLVLIALADFKIRPVIKTISAYQARVFSGRIINNAITQELTKEDVNYSNIVNITLNEDGKVSSLQTDIVKLNKLRSSLINAVIVSIQDMQNQDINIPLGTLTGVQLLSGRGPKITFKIIPAGFIETSLENKFDTAGINQTRHQIMLNINLTVTAIVPGFSTTTEVATNFCLAETVIVGMVPEAFTNIEGSQDPQGDIFDFGAERNYTVDRSPDN